MSFNYNSQGLQVDTKPNSMYKVEEQMVPSALANGKFVARQGYTPLYLDNFVVGTQEEFDSIIQGETLASPVPSCNQLPTYAPTQNSQYYSAYQHNPSPMGMCNLGYNENNGNSARLSPSGDFDRQQMMATVPSPMAPFESVCSQQSFYAPSPTSDCYPAYSPGNIKASSNQDNLMQNLCGNNNAANSTNNTSSASLLNDMDRSKMTLRECLADTSYQTKFNLKSVDFPVINGTHEVTTEPMKSEANMTANRDWPRSNLMGQKGPTTSDLEHPWIQEDFIDELAKQVGILPKDEPWHKGCDSSAYMDFMEETFAEMLEKESKEKKVFERAFVGQLDEPQKETKANVCEYDSVESDITDFLDKPREPLTAEEQLLQNEMQTLCDNTRISPDPSKWSVIDAHTWMCHSVSNIILCKYGTARDFNTISKHCNDHYGNVDGPALSSFNEEDFKKRDPLLGYELSKSLESWKSGYIRFYQCNDFSDVLEILGMSDSSNTWSTYQNSPEDKKFMPGEQCSHDLSSSPRFSNASSGNTSSSSKSSDEEDDEDDKPSEKVKSSRTPGSKSGAHIHLWQFLRELLDQDQQHGSCIQWVDRKQGIFRIVDSVRVAKLWGTRKNRPAMNYDKLSRSIRQYYKKGIMKKTERSQRLVYQFCPAFIH